MIKQGAPDSVWEILPNRVLYKHMLFHQILDGTHSLTRILMSIIVGYLSYD